MYKLTFTHNRTPKSLLLGVVGLFFCYFTLVSQQVSWLIFIASCSLIGAALLMRAAQQHTPQNGTLLLQEHSLELFIENEQIQGEATSNSRVINQLVLLQLREQNTQHQRWFLLWKSSFNSTDFSRLCRYVIATHQVK